VFDGTTLASLNSHDLLDPKDEFGAPLYTVHRADLLNELLHLASGLDLRLGTKVTTANAEEGYVILKDGSRHPADLIIAGDGVHSALRTEVLRGQGSAQTNHSGMSTFRFMIPTEAIQDDPQFQMLLKIKGKGCCLFADTTRESEHHMVWFTCREYLNHALLIPRTKHVNLSHRKSVQVFVGVHDSIVANPDGRRTLLRYFHKDARLTNLFKELKDLMLAEFSHYHPSLVHMFK
jgi:salicylate hydroxylase